MPLRIRWKSGEYLPFALMMFGMCGLFQLIFIFIAQYFLDIGNYFIIIIIPIAVTAALYYSSKIIFESYAQIERRNKLKSQFRKAKISETRIKKILEFPISKPILVTFGIFTFLFIIGYIICILFSDSMVSFLIAENAGAIACLVFADYFEKNYGKIRRF
ncbi:MAG: hypothetical protein ACFFBP_21540 [Promethearchaeota archaeon]